MRVRICIALAGAAVLLAACGDNGDSTPVACLEGSGPYLRALAAAPGAVELGGGPPISECLSKNQQGGDLATIGMAMVTAATRLNTEAREDPGGRANLELGYLLGAAERGAEQTSGIHAELVRRLAAAARYSPDNRPPPAIFLETYREGFDAGAANG